MNIPTVLIMSTAYLPYIGGAEIAMKEITDRISPDAYRFVMITARMGRHLPKRETIGNIEVYRIGIGHKTIDKYILTLWGHVVASRLHTTYSFSLVWSLMASYNGFAAERFARKKKVPFLLTLQEGDPLPSIEKKVRFVFPWFRRIFQSATALQAISTYLLDWGKRLGYDGMIAKVIPNGVDVASFAALYTDTQKQECRASFGFPSDATILITVSRLVTKNGVEDIIRALQTLPSSVCLVVCGSGELETRLRDITNDCHLEKRVVFLGNMPYTSLPLLLQSSDIFIRPSLSEGLGNAFLEAMAAGISVIGTPVGGIPDFLVDGETGFFCQPENPESVAQVVTRVMALSKEEKEHVLMQAKQCVQQRYQWKDIVSQMMCILSDTIKK